MILFLDIETVPQYKSIDLLPERDKELWMKKHKHMIDVDAIAYYDHAGLYAEFGKIVCISVGIVSRGTLRVKSFYGHDEVEILSKFTEMLHQQPSFVLCGHNAKEFDCPFIARRCIINGIILPSQLDIAGRKPWEVTTKDTMDMWKLGAFKHFISLDLLCHCLGVETSKDNMDGSEVHTYYYEKEDLEGIKTYCEKDVIATAQCFHKMKLREGFNHIEHA